MGSIVATRYSENIRSFICSWLSLYGAPYSKTQEQKKTFNKVGFRRLVKVVILNFLLRENLFVYDCLSLFLFVFITSVVFYLYQTLNYWTKRGVYQTRPFLPFMSSGLIVTITEHFNDFSLKPRFSHVIVLTMWYIYHYTHMRSVSVIINV